MSEQGMRILPQRRRSWPVLTVFALMVMVQLGVAVASLDLLAAVRAYVAGESLYSKGQKDAQIHLAAYADTLRDQDYTLFLNAISVPIGDRAAREALQRQPPDHAAARRGFLQGGNHPDDIDGLIRAFLWFGETPLMADAVRTWSEGDRLIEEIRRLAADAHREAGVVGPSAPSLSTLRVQALTLNRQLTELESRFAAQLGESARLAQRLLVGLNVALASLLGVTGLLFVRYRNRVQSATEDEVRRRQESLQRLLDSSAEGLYGVDLEGRCTFVNRAALRMLGYEREEQLIGSDIQARIHRADATGTAPGEPRIARAFREREELHLSEVVLFRRDGSSFPVEYWSHPIVEDDRLLGAVVTFFEISERLRMQAAVRQGEVRIAGLVDAVNDAVVTVDSARRVVLFNRAAERLFGVSAGDAIGGDVDRLIPRHLGSGRGALTQRLFAEDGSMHPGSAVRELTGVRADGQHFALEASMSALQTDRGLMVTAVLRDATDLRTARAERQAREALEAASQAKTEFLSRMSHELRTPLNAVLGFSQLLRLDSNLPPSLEQLERIQHIENAGSHLLALVNDVLDLSRVESGQLTMVMESVEVGAVADDAIAMVMPLAASTGVSLGRDPGTGAAEDDVFVRADPLRLRQVLVNLLSNAVKYNRPGGRVRVGWSAADGRCRIRVVDNGVGMSAEKVRRLFEPFNRLGAESSAVEGTGIGLVLSQRLAELMSGALAVDSTPGVGTEASLRLFTAEGPSGFDRLPAVPSQHGDLEPDLRVIYAEDNEVNVILVEQMVSLRPSVRLEIARDGAAAVAAARRAPPPLMLVDMNLGDMTGFDVADALRAEASTARIRLVALSADALPAQIDAALDAGFDRYLTKPIELRQLLDVLDEHLAAPVSVS